MSVEACCDAVQAVERLHLQLKRDDNIHESVFQKCIDSLENLRLLKSSLEGSEITISAPVIEESCLLELKQLALMHVPSSLNDLARENFVKLISKTFDGTDVNILFAALITCPWYGSSQKERGEQAKYNTVFIVYQTSLEHFMAPVNAHLVDQTNVIDLEWFYACELYHFVQFLSKGKTRYVEVLYCPQEAVVYQTPIWQDLRSNLPPCKVTGLKGFVEACRGQSVGGIGKKGKDGRFRLKDSTTFRQLCDSFRLLHHVYNSINGLPPCTNDVLEQYDNIHDIIQKSLDLLKSMYQNPDISKKDAFTLLCDWKTEVDKCLGSKFKYTPSEEVDSIIGKWHMTLRLQGKTYTPHVVPQDGISEMLGILETVGGPVTKLKPEQILLITQAGSYMYGLNTATSDTDYVIIYAENTETFLTSCKRLPEIVESRGPSKQVEYGAYEVRCFSEMLLKGSVVILELVYKDDHNYMSPAWKALCKQKKKFLSEKGIQQYMGLIKNNLGMIKREKHKGNPQERKLFYQIYHKLYSLEFMINNEPPPVKCTGSTKDYIMRIRTQPLVGDLDRDVLHKDCITKVDDFKRRLANRTTRLRENCDFEYLIDWIITVRGVVTNVT